MRKLPTALCCLLVCCFDPCPARAQEWTAGTAPPATATKVDTSKEAIVYEQMRGHLRYEADGTGSKDTYARIRVQSYAGVRKVGQLVFNYDSANSQIEVRTIRVTKSDGKVVTAGPEAIQDMTSPTAQAAPTYTDLRQKHVVVPDLSPGDTLEYETFTTYRPLTPGKVWQVWDFISDTICLDEQVEIDAASTLSLKTTTTGAPNPSMVEKGDRTLWTWKTDHLVHGDLPVWIPSTSPFPDAKALLSGANLTHPRRIWITSFASWAELSAWYARLEHDPRIASPEVRAKAQELTRNAHSDLEKTRAIYDYVARNIRYVSLSFGVGRYQPHAAADVLAHQYGDCKDKTTLLEALLESVGIQAWPALLMASGYMDDVPSPLEFDHVISYLVVDGQELWLDSTLGVAPFGYLLPNVRGKRALITTPEKGAELRAIPADLPTATVYRLALDGKLDDDRKLGALLSFETRGDWEVLFRLSLVQSSVAQMQSAIEAAAKKSRKADDLALSDLDASDPYDTASPFRLRVRLTGTLPEETETPSKDNSAKSSASDSPLTSKNMEEMLSLFLPEGDFNQAVVLGDPKEVNIHIKFVLGPQEAAKVTGKTPDLRPVHLVRDFAEYDQSWSWEAPTLTAEGRIATKVASVSKDRASEYSAFRSAVGAELKEIAYALGAPRSEGPSVELAVRYADAVQAIEAEKFAGAQQTLESIVKDDPNFVSAWSSLAEVRARRKDWEGSGQAYQKLIALHAADHGVYNGLIRAYIAERLYSEAITSAKKELEEFPNLPDGRYNLGWAHLEAEQFEQAAEAYELATKLLPRNARVLIQLGRAYAGAHEMGSARTAFGRAVQLDTSPPTLNAVAYYSAEAGLDLERAEEESKRAVASIENQVNAVKLRDFNGNTIELLTRLAAYWDTLGWIRFKKGDLAGAEKFLRAASDLSEESTIQMHMGRIEEELGHQKEAMRFYVAALDARQIPMAKQASSGKQVAPPRRPQTPTEREAHKRLVALAGSQAAVDEQRKEGSSNRNLKRIVAVPYADAHEESEQVGMLLAPGPRITSSRIMAGPEGQSKLLGRFDEHTPPQMFPDEGITSIPRLGVIRCRTNPAECEFEFLTNERAEELFVDSDVF